MSILEPPTQSGETEEILAANEAEIARLNKVIETVQLRIQEIKDDSNNLRAQFRAKLTTTAEPATVETFNFDKFISYIESLPGVCKVQLESKNPLQDKVLIPVKLNHPESKQKIEAQFMYCRKEKKLMLFSNKKLYSTNRELIDSISNQFGQFNNVNSPKRSVYFWTNLNPRFFS